MTKKNWLLVLFLAAAAVVYVIWFTDWFRTKHIHIFHTVRQVHFRRRASDPDRVVIFGVEPRDIYLTEIKVVSLADFEKDPKTLPAWRLISESNSAPVREFVYGQHIRGMHPLVEGMEPAELDTNQVYRIFISAKQGIGQHDFKINNSSTQPADTNSP
jgi:hypothetical protein